MFLYILKSFLQHVNVFILIKSKLNTNLLAHKQFYEKYLVNQAGNAILEIAWISLMEKMSSFHD